MNATPAQRFPRTASLVATLVFGLVAFVWWTARQPEQAPPAANVVPRNQLVLRDGLLYPLDGTNLFTGIVIEAYSTGELMSRSSVVAGRLEGLSEGWHTNGVRQVEEHFVAGVSHGTRTKWHPNGQKASEANIVSGHIEELFRRWHENGTLAEEITLVHDVPNGPARAYYPSGCLKANATMKDGKVLEQRFYADGERPAGQELAAASPAR